MQGSLQFRRVQMSKQKLKLMVKASAQLLSQQHLFTVFEVARN
jgi:hypothetical protein